jgi:hypothetical protein
MSTSTRSPARASLATTTGWARGARQAIAAGTPGRASRLAWLAGAAVASSLAANFPSSACQPVTAHWLRIYPPGETVAGYVSHTFSACSSASAVLLTVLPVRAGQGAAGGTP